MQTQTIAPNRKRKNVVLIVAVLLLGFGLVALVGGAVIGVLNQTATDSEGYSLSHSYQVSTSSSTYAFVLGFNPYSQDAALTKWVVTPTETGKTLFVGWASIDDTLNYLDGVQFSSPSYWEWDYGAYSSTLEVPVLLTLNGAAPSSLPSSESFWLDSASSNEAVTLHFYTTWEPALGNRSLVIMNADGSPDVKAGVQFGSKMLVFSWLPYVLIPIGSALCIAGAIVLTRRRWLNIPERSFPPELVNTTSYFLDR